MKHQDRVMVKRIVGRCYINLAHTSREKPTLERVLYFFEKGGYPVIASASETGSREAGYARIVCNADGSKAEGFPTKNNKRVLFNFKPEEVFTVIDLVDGRFSLHSFKLRERGRDYVLEISLIAQNKELAMLSGEFEYPVPEWLMPFREAIRAGVLRLNCSGCEHAHFSN